MRPWGGGSFSSSKIHSQSSALLSNSATITCLCAQEYDHAETALYFLVPVKENVQFCASLNMGVKFSGVVYRGFLTYCQECCT